MEQECGFIIDQVFSNSVSFFVNPYLSKNLVFGDWIYHILSAEKGKIYFINEVMAAYRVTDKGLTKSTPKYITYRDISILYERLKSITKDKDIFNLLKKHISSTSLNIYIELKKDKKTRKK